MAGDAMIDSFLRWALQQYLMHAGPLLATGPSSLSIPRARVRVLEMIGPGVVEVGP